MTRQFRLLKPTRGEKMAVAVGASLAMFICVILGIAHDLKGGETMVSTDVAFLSLVIGLAILILLPIVYRR